MILSIASGKGGTGKTTVAVNLALAMSQWEKVHLVDADVEEPNIHIFLQPKITSTVPVTIASPHIDLARCSFCGRCAEVCAYNAITVIRDTALVFPELCHGCGACTRLCPEGVIHERPRPIGVIEQGRTRGMAFTQGRLNPGEALTAPVTRAARATAGAPGRMTIVDAPPGTSCPAVEAVRGSHLCLLVTEPTPFGLNDLALAVEMARRLSVPCAVVVNRADLGDDRIDHYCQAESIPVLDRLPHDAALASAYARGEPAALASPAWMKRFEALAERTLALCREVRSA